MDSKSRKGNQEKKSIVNLVSVRNQIHISEIKDTKPITQFHDDYYYENN